MFNRKKLIKIMDKKNFSAYKLWKTSGVAQSTISNILNNDNINPTTNTLSRLADALGVSVNDFFDDENNENENIEEDRSTRDKDIDTIAAHLEGKNLTPQKIKLLEQYIDALFDDEDFDD